jgi:hypothetical protein
MNSLYFFTNEDRVMIIELFDNTGAIHTKNIDYETRSNNARVVRNIDLFCPTDLWGGIPLEGERIYKNEEVSYKYNIQYNDIISKDRFLNFYIKDVQNITDETKRLNLAIAIKNSFNIIWSTLNKE